MQKYHFRKTHDIIPEKLADESPYIAGLMDGEGCFRLQKLSGKKIRFRPLIQLAMTDEPTVAYIGNIFGVNYQLVKRKNKKKYHKKVYRLLVTTEAEMNQIAKALVVHSITKKRQMEIMINFFELEATKEEANQQEVLQKEIELYIENSQLNQRGKPKNFVRIRAKLLKCVC